MVTVQLAAHITISGVLRLPGQVLLVTTVLAANLVASGYAHYSTDTQRTPIVMAQSVVVLSLGDPVPGGLPAGTVILRRPT